MPSISTGAFSMPVTIGEREDRNDRDYRKYPIFRRGSVWVVGGDEETDVGAFQSGQQRGQDINLEINEVFKGIPP